MPIPSFEMLLIGHNQHNSYIYSLKYVNVYYDSNTMTLQFSFRNIIFLLTADIFPSLNLCEPICPVRTGDANVYGFICML